MFRKLIYNFVKTSLKFNSHLSHCFDLILFASYFHLGQYLGCQGEGGSVKGLSKWGCAGVCREGV